MDRTTSHSFITDNRDLSIRRTVQTTNLSKSTFSLNHSNRFSTDMGFLTPVMLIEALPGDEFTISHEVQARFTALLFPVMHDVRLQIRSFFVPNRICFANDVWEKFMTLDSNTEWAWVQIDNVTNIIKLKGPAAHMGIPVQDQVGTGQYVGPVSAIPLAGYLKIYDEWFRNPYLQDKLFPDGLVSGDNQLTTGLVSNALINPQCIPANHNIDYFTTCLPLAQFGDDVLIPMFDAGIGVNPNIKYYRDTNGTTLPAVGAAQFRATGALTDTASSQNFSPMKSIQENAASINDLRLAYAMQRYYEHLQRGGIRYVEQLAVRFGVDAGDHRLNRPEYIGGARGRMQITDVLSTSETVNSLDQTLTSLGNYAGYGVGMVGGQRYSYTVPEHGYVHTIFNVQPRTAYYQGLARHWRREIPEQYYNPEFQDLGEQEVLNREIFVDDGDGLDDEVFGYVPYGHEYRFHNDSVNGDFRNQLKFAHFSRYFATRPVLGPDFLYAIDAPDDAFVDKDTTDTVLVWLFNHVNVRRVLPVSPQPANV